MNRTTHHQPPIYDDGGHFDRRGNGLLLHDFAPAEDVLQVQTSSWRCVIMTMGAGVVKRLAAPGVGASFPSYVSHRTVRWAQGDDVVIYRLPPRMDATSLQQAMPAPDLAQLQAVERAQRNMAAKLQTLQHQDWSETPNYRRLTSQLMALDAGGRNGHHVVPITQDLLLTGQGLAVQEVAVLLVPRFILPATQGHALGDLWTRKMITKRFISLAKAQRTDSVLRYLTRSVACEQALRSSSICRLMDLLPQCPPTKAGYVAQRTPGKDVRERTTTDRPMSFTQAMAQDDTASYCGAHLCAEPQEQHNQIWHWLQIAARHQSEAMAPSLLDRGDTKAEVFELYCKYGTFGHTHHGYTPYSMSWQFASPQFKLEFLPDGSR